MRPLVRRRFARRGAAAAFATCPFGPCPQRAILPCRGLVGTATARGLPRLYCLLSARAKAVAMEPAGPLVSP